MFNYLPNNRQVNPPPLFYDNNKTNTNLDTSSSSTTTNNLQNSNFSNFNNFKAMLDQQHKQKSKYFDIYYPTGKDQMIKKNKNNSNNQSEQNSACESLSSSQSSTLGNDLNELLYYNQSDSIRPSVSRKNSTTVNCYSNRNSQPPSRKNSTTINYNNNNNNQQFNNQQFNNQQINSKKDEIKSYNLQSTPVQFDMDKVKYVKTLNKAQTVVDLIQTSSKVIALNCDSDCCLQNGIDLLEVAVTFDESLDHPSIYIFDIYEEPQIIELFKPIFANASIRKVMFDARYDLRILARKYGVTEFRALFDIQLAYRVLLSKLTKTPFEEVKREKLLYVSWQCNGPLTNFEKLHLPSVYYFKNKQFWKKRPVNFELMYTAAYDVFVLVPQLFTNLIIIMERTLNDEYKEMFIRHSNDLITKNLTSRKFAFFQTKHQYLGEMHKQIDLLIHSDTLNRLKLANKWQISSITTTTTTTSEEDSLDGESYCGDEEDRICTKCNQHIKSDKLTQLIDSINSSDKSLLFNGSYGCKCFNQSNCLDDEIKCMNLLVDQIIDLAECKEDYMELDE